MILRYFYSTGLWVFWHCSLLRMILFIIISWYFHQLLSCFKVQSLQSFWRNNAKYFRNNERWCEWCVMSWVTGMQTQGHTKESTWKHKQPPWPHMWTCADTRPHTHTCTRAHVYPVSLWTGWTSQTFLSSSQWGQPEWPLGVTNMQFKQPDRRGSSESVQSREGGGREEESTARESCSTNYSTNTTTAPRKASKKKIKNPLLNPSLDYVFLA